MSQQLDRMSDSNRLRSLDELAGAIAREHKDARRDLASFARHATAAGAMLLDVKAQLPHGEWLRWLAVNFEGSMRTAQTYMRIAGDPKAQRTAHLGVRAALRELAPAADRANVGPTPASDERQQRRERLIAFTSRPGSITKRLEDTIVLLDALTDTVLDDDAVRELQTTVAWGIDLLDNHPLAVEHEMCRAAEALADYLETDAEPLLGVAERLVPLRVAHVVDACRERLASV